MRFRVLAIRLALMCAVAAAAPVAARAETFPFYREHVLGTSLEVQIDADDRAAAEAAEAAVVAEIDRLAKIFSNYDRESELSRWESRAGEPVALSSELVDVLRMSEGWRQASRGAFNPAVESLTQLWRGAEKTGVVPGDAELRRIVRQIETPQWALDEAAGRVRRTGTLPLTFNAIAKGHIVDLASARGHKSQGVRGLLVSIGGDMRVRGSMVRRISIADPRNDAVNAAPLQAVFLTRGGLATSGNYRRGFEVAKTWYSHILDPRTGRPAEGVASATVVAATSAEADALATICNVLPVRESLTLVESVSGAECLIVETGGAIHESAGWADLQKPGLYRLAERAAQFVAAESDDKTPAAQPELLELEVKFQLAKPEGAGYRRPYVAVWLEDADEFPVKTALLWMTTKQPGPRWHRDLIRWYRNDRARKLADDTDLIGTISGATRGPGDYKAVFDGLDDAGKPLKAGKYTLYVEVAREHGTYQLIRQPLTLGADPIAATKLKGNVEVESASYEYRAAPPAAGGKSN